MSKEIYISSTPHETRLAIVENEALTEIYYERENEYTLAGSIYNGRVTRVLPGMQSSFVDIGLERDAFLYITDFMEEAPDSAEFDTSSNGDHAPRAPRVAEGEPAARSEGARSSEREDRGGRGRRGGRNRGAGQDRQASPESSRSSAADHSTVEPSTFAETRDQGAIAPSEGLAANEIGEGAPGADGSRRWRGRRGRRRGRGNTGAQTAETGPAEVPSALPEADSEFEGETILEGGAALEGDSPFAIEGAAAEAAVVPAQRNGFSLGSREDSPRGEGSRGDGQRNGRRDVQRADAPRKDQGRDRDKGRGQGGDKGREQRPDRGQRVPRGFAPTHDLYAVDAGQTSAYGSTGPVANAYPDAGDATSAEPMILPGESLSKYRKGGEEPARTEPATASVAAPSSLYTLAEGWDGGATLPGETLSRRRVDSGASQGGDSRREFRRDGQSGSSRDQGAGRGGREDRGARSQSRENRPQAGAANRSGDRAAMHNTPAPVEETESTQLPRITAQPVAIKTPSLDPEAASDLGANAQAPGENAQAQMEPVDAHGSDGALPQLTAETIAEAVMPVPESADYEPDEASASYRVDPLPRSEYRQSAPVLDAPPEANVEAQMEEQIQAEIPASTEPPAAQAHDITAISAAGEMFSERIDLQPEAAQHPAPMEIAEPTSPILHESAIVTHEARSDDQAVDAQGVHATGHVQAGPGLGALHRAEPSSGFAPGAGVLDEEILEDEEPGATIYASSIEEMDDLDEETLEGAADLGTMLREMSIDNITRTSPQIGDDQEDLEELEEDELDEDELEEEDAEDDGSDEQDNLDDEDEDEDADGEELEEQAARSGSADEQEFFGQPSGQAVEGSDLQAVDRPSGSGSGASGRDSGVDTDRRGVRRDGRRDGRRGRERSGRPNSNGRGRHSMQSTNLPAISDLLKPGQEILVQIAKEPIAKKGARITSHIALPGRFLVFMPTVNHTGVSRKIESDAERRRLKEILLSEKGEASGGFIVRTAASGASEDELRSDLRFLLNLWSDIKARSESSKSPALIYHDLNLIERILRDQVTDNFSAIWVDTDTEYERVLRFLQRFQPSLIRRVKLYSKETPLFEQFGITEEINKALRSKVWLKSGGSIVINQTEALVAIDINTGKFVGKTARLEDTIVKTNLDAIPEIVRQIRLRDLGGIIIIDFIDMDERKNRNRVMAALEEELKSDRAPSKVLQFNDFGLVAITRKRVKQSLERTLSTTCNVCVGTGMVKSPVTVCNDIYVEMKKMHKHLDRGDVMLRVHPEVVKQLKTSGSKWLQEMEEMAGKTILVKSDPSLHPEQFDIH
jgi:ribonuclease E